MLIQIGEVCLDKVNQYSHKGIPIITKQGERLVESSKSKKYLLPCLKEYGTEFISKLESVFKVAVGIGDIVVSNRGISHEKHIFILLDSAVCSDFFLAFIEWIRLQPMYTDDYVYGNIQKSHFHMVVIKLPEAYYETFETFKMGKYSRMYNEQQMNRFFEDHPDVVKVIIKDHNYKIRFVRGLNKIFGTTLTAKDWADNELELPPTDETDKFNHHLKKKDG